MKVEYTQRGFEFIDFPHSTDEEKKSKLVQASSSIGPYDDSYDRPGSSYLWIGSGSDRPHLNREEVADFVQHLQNWLNTGSLSHISNTENVDV